MSDEEKVAYVLTVDRNLPPGAKVEIPGLGAFEDGSYNITEAQAHEYRVFHQIMTPVYDDKTNELLNYNREFGPTLLEASKGMGEGFTVKAASQPKSSKEGGK